MALWGSGLTVYGILTEIILFEVMIVTRVILIIPVIIIAVIIIKGPDNPTCVALPECKKYTEREKKNGAKKR